MKVGFAQYAGRQLILAPMVVWVVDVELFLSAKAAT